MTIEKKTRLKKLIFPVGIFLLMFTAQSVIGTAGVVSYFFLSGKKNISDIEEYTINYSKTMAEAFTRVAEFSYSTKKYSSLKTLFHEKIEENTIDEAFFVLKDGKIVVHSSTTTEKELMGNIASDEMSYNLDMILYPMETKNQELILNNYNIVNKTVPFPREERELIKKYAYKNINSTGWLFTKGVFHKNKPVGTVNFIISKDRIFTSISESVEQAKYYSIIVIMISMILSFFVSIIVLFRYRSIQKNALKSGTYPVPASAVPAAHFTPAIGETQNDGDVILFPQQDNIVEPLMDDFIDDDFDDNVVIEEDDAIPTIRTYEKKDDKSGVIHLRKHELPADDDEYITVELIGEIESGKADIHPVDKSETVKEFIAPVISLEDYKKSLNKEIRDAIPIRRKR